MWAAGPAVVELAQAVEGPVHTWAEACTPRVRIWSGPTDLRRVAG